jgi:hypothetical protein
MWLAPIGWIRTKLLERKERIQTEKFTRGYDWAKTFLDVAQYKEAQIEILYSYLTGAETFGEVDYFDRGVVAAVREQRKQAVVCKHH